MHDKTTTQPRYDQEETKSCCGPKVDMRSNE